MGGGKQWTSLRDLSSTELQPSLSAVIAIALHDAIMPTRTGCLAVPQGPGLGIDPDPAVIEKLRVR